MLKVVGHVNAVNGTTVLFLIGALFESMYMSPVGWHQKRNDFIFHWITYKTNKTSLLVAAANVLNIGPAHFSSSKL